MSRSKPQNAMPELGTPPSLADILNEPEPTPAALKPAWAEIDLPKTLAFTDKPKRRIYYDYSEVENAVKLLKKLPSEGETVHAVMDSHFKGVDLVPAILKLSKRPAKELIVTTLGFNRRDAACLCELKEKGDIQSMMMVCSNFFAEKDQGAYTYASERFATVGADVIQGKITLYVKNQPDTPSGSQTGPEERPQA